MRILRRGLIGALALAIVALGVVLAFDEPAKPPVLASISEPFAKVDYSDLPKVDLYSARDGVSLGYRTYDGKDAQVILMIHGSSDDGSGMHSLAKAMRDAGASVYVPVVRGHFGSGRFGDLDYIGQLDDDLADFVSVLRHRRPNARYTLLGFSSGGGFALRTIAGANERLFDSFLLVSPALPYDAPTIRPGTGGWVSLAMPRIIALTMLNRVGVKLFNGLPVIAFATSPKATHLTGVYSFRLVANFGASRDYLAGIGRSTKPAALLVGGSDELFFADRFAPLFRSARADLRMTVVPGIGHIGMTVAPEGIAAVRQSFLDLTTGTKN